jgi:hypothetical protein
MPPGTLPETLARVARLSEQCRVEESLLEDLRAKRDDAIVDALEEHTRNDIARASGLHPTRITRIRAA